MKNTFTFAANISYDGFTYNTKLICEYEHTGGYYFMKTNKGKYILDGEESANIKMKEGKKVFYSNGYFYIKRLAIPTVNAKGKSDIWYINNSGDTFQINKVSKYGKKIHKILSEESKPYPVKIN
jgi:hypothetical protein